LKNTSMEKFVEFIVSNTDQRILAGIDDSHTIHERIAINVLDEMALIGNGAALTQYSLVLKTLNLQGIKAADSMNLKRLLLKVKAIAKTNQVKNSLEAFQKYLEKFDTDVDPTIPDLSSLGLTNAVVSDEVRRSEDGEEDVEMQTSDREEVGEGDLGEGDYVGGGYESDDMFE